MPAPADLPDLPATFRPRRTRVVLLSTGAALLAVFTVIAVALPHDGPTAWGTGDRATFVGTGLVIFAVLAVLSRPKIVADRDGVTVVNLTVKRRLEWAELVRVNLRPGDPWVYLDLADGTTMAAMGIQPGAGRDRAVRAAGRLRALAEAYGTGRAPGGPGTPGAPGGDGGAGTD
ncbi:membrane protein [Wenjunlia tyrosinilytica]|uniref:Membrane protein n=1 Tax=Wenjunlia tyrosinilytica TaxID=1544741 RepID=A0A918DTX2_9ACTN|nr:membrane protein [Wenjunlia tyrosinilytica]